MTPYKVGTTLDQIIRDGWSRGFDPEQTLREAGVMGFDLDKAALSLQWTNLTADMDRDMDRDQTI